jgi:hypothetical protein
MYFKDFARVISIMQPDLEHLDIEVQDALAKLCTADDSFNRADGLALASELLLHLRRASAARGGRVRHWTKAPKY